MTGVQVRTSSRLRGTGPAFPTREYIGAMCLEMARMAEVEGDAELASLLRQAAVAAGAPS